MRRQLSDTEELAAIHILRALPEDVIATLLKNGQLPIADVFLFCHLSDETHRLCIDKNVWRDMYKKRFPNPQYRLHSNQIAHDMRFRKGSVIDIQFDASYVRILAVEREIDHTEVTAIISSICGRPDERGKWTRDLGSDRKLFYKMIVYKMLEAGWIITSANGVIACTICTASSDSKCNRCQVPLCGTQCFDSHQCIEGGVKRGREVFSAEDVMAKSERKDPAINNYLGWVIEKIPIYEIAFSYDMIDVEKAKRYMDIVGQMPPIILVPDKEGYRIIDGYHRVAVARMRGYKEIYAIVPL